MRIHWGVQIPIMFRRDDSMDATPFSQRIKGRRVNKTRSFHNDLFIDMEQVGTVPPQEGSTKSPTPYIDSPEASMRSPPDH